MKGRPGDVPLLGALLLLEAFQVLETEGLELLDGESDLLQKPKRDSCGLEGRDAAPPAKAMTCLARSGRGSESKLSR